MHESTSRISPGFAEKYAAYAIERVRAAGGSQEAIDAKAREMKSFKEMYDKPLFNAAITFLEPFPIGLVMTLISAAVLRRKPQDVAAGRSSADASYRL